MKKLVLLLLFALVALHLKALPRFYLLSVAEMNIAYELYGHSAIRVVDDSLHIDFIVDWGVFDFNQPNFYVNFATGRMLYTTSTQEYENFLGWSHYFRKGVSSREIMLNETQREHLWRLIRHNLDPQNRDYYYRVIQDNCATRPRDLLEQTLGEDLLYPSNPPEDITFRDILHHYQQPQAWYNLVIDLVLGSRVDKKADFRAQMFIPEYLEKNLAQAMVRDYTLVHPLLGESVVIVEKIPLHKTPFLLTPEFIFSLLFLLVLLLDCLKKGRSLLRIVDFCFFSLIIFCGLLITLLWAFSLHQEAYDNFNIFWLNPLFVLPLVALRTDRKKLWLLLTAYYVLLFGLVASLGILPQTFPFTMYVALLIILERCYFGWRAKKQTA